MRDAEQDRETLARGREPRKGSKRGGGIELASGEYPLIEAKPAPRRCACWSTTSLARATRFASRNKCVHETP